MNDCIWNCMDVCEDCKKCEKYISVNSDEGGELMHKYMLEVNIAIEPVCRKWREIFNDYRANQ